MAHAGAVLAVILLLGACAAPSGEAGVAGPSRSTDTPSETAVYPAAGEAFAAEVGTERADQIHHYGRCRPQRGPTALDLRHVFPHGQWITYQGAAAQAWLDAALNAPTDSGDITILDFGEESAGVVLDPSVVADLDDAVQAEAIIHLGRPPTDTAPFPGVVALTFPDGLFASAAPCGFIDHALPLYDWLADRGMPATDAAATFIAAQDAGDADWLPGNPAEPVPTTTPSTSDGRVDLDVHPSGLSMRRIPVSLRLPVSWQAIGGHVCFEVPAGVGGCRSVRTVAQGEAVRWHAPADAGDPITLVWSRDRVGATYDAVALGQTSVPADPTCRTTLTGVIEADATSEADLRRLADQGPLARWSTAIRPAQSEPSDPSTIAPLPCDPPVAATPTPGS